jgi:hypothetical protein
MSEADAGAKLFLSYEEIEDILGRDVVRRLERVVDEAKAAAGAAYPDGGHAALEMLVLLHLVSILTRFLPAQDAIDRAERAGTLLRYFVMNVMTARTEVMPLHELEPTFHRTLS